MTTLRTAAQQALEALESLFNWHVDPVRGQRCSDAITALRAALEQPKPELQLDGMAPLQFALEELHAFQEATGCDTASEFRASLEQPEQEPVAWLNSRPLYYDPPRREWRGLTEEEIDAVWEDAQVFNTHYDIARAIEQALRSKNHE